MPLAPRPLGDGGVDPHRDRGFQLMQPFVLWAFTYSFFVTLLGTVLFIIVSHFPE